MKENYSYPLDPSWSKEELYAVISMYQAIEMAYEKSILVDDFLNVYKGFKEAIPSIGEERRLSREFEEITGYSLYHAVKVARSTNKKSLKMGD